MNLRLCDEIYNMTNKNKILNIASITFAVIVLIFLLKWGMQELSSVVGSQENGKTEEIGKIALIKK